MLIRVALAIDEKERQKNLQNNLQKDDILLTKLEKRGPFKAIVEEPFDLLIISEEKLPKPVEKTLRTITDLPESPSIVLLTATDNEKRRAAFLTAGCDAVLHSGLPDEMLLDAIKTIITKREEAHAGALQGRVKLAEPRLADFVSHSSSMMSFINVARRVARTNASLMILGETGVGKERLALAIHAEGRRSDAPFIPINCAALPDSLLESELFGYEQGAFTGAVRTRRGAFELAHKGTIFLDEIGDMPLSLQAKLLRVLQDGKFYKLGSEKPISVDVRVMAATNRDLMEDVEAGHFRQDLFYRLGVVALTIPPLRERREDIPELINSYIDYLAPRIGVGVFDIDSEAVETMTRYDWPGNVRELINVLERAMLLCDGEEIGVADLPVEIVGEKRKRSGSTLTEIPELAFFAEPEGKDNSLLPWKEVRKKILDHYEKAYLDELLLRAGGNINRTASLADLTTRALYSKMREHGLAKEDYK